MSGTGGLRRARGSDLEAVAGLWRGLVLHHERLDDAYRTQPGADGEFAAVAREMIASADATVLVWEEAGDLVGFATARLVKAPPELVEGRRGEILELVVRPDARRRGVGRALAEAACHWVRERGAERIEIRVHARNAEGQAFWRALGWADFVDVLERHL